MTVSVQDRQSQPGGPYIRWIELDRPAAANALNLEMLTSLVGALEHAQVDPSVGAIVLSGAGGRHFCAGRDVQDVGTGAEVAGGRFASFRAGLVELLCLLATFEKPVVAMIEGAAVGAGAMIACSVDIAVMSERAYLSFPELDVGFPPVIAYELLDASVGASCARALLASGRRMAADECVQRGLAARSVAAGDVRQVGEDEAQRLAATPASAFAIYKRHVGAGLTPRLRAVAKEVAS